MTGPSYLAHILVSNFVKLFSYGNSIAKAVKIRKQLGIERVLRCTRRSQSPNCLTESLSEFVPFSGQRYCEQCVLYYPPHSFWKGYRCDLFINFFRRRVSEFRRKESLFLEVWCVCERVMSLLIVIAFQSLGSRSCYSQIVTEPVNGADGLNFSLKSSILRFDMD